MILSLIAAMYAAAAAAAAEDQAARNVQADSSEAPLCMPYSEFRRLKTTSLDEIMEKMLQDKINNAPSSRVDDDAEEQRTEMLGEDVWQSIVEHGWDINQHLVRKGSNRQRGLLMAHPTASGDSGDGQHQQRGMRSSSEIAGPSASERATPYIACCRPDSTAKGTRCLANLAQRAGATTLTDNVVLSNARGMLCTYLSTTFSYAIDFAQHESQDEYCISPFIDVMKIQTGAIDQVTKGDFAVPYLQGLMGGPESEVDWERSISVGLSRGLNAGSENDVLEAACGMIEDVQAMAEEGNRRRRRNLERSPIRRIGEGRLEAKDSAGRTLSVTEAFSLTSTVGAGSSLSSLGRPKRHRRHLSSDLWSRVLENGIESDHQCSTMFETLVIRPRIGNIGFDIILNPRRNTLKTGASCESATKDSNDGASMSESSASNKDCLLSLVAALSTHPHVLSVDLNSEITFDNDRAQWITQSNRKDERPFFDVGLDGSGQIVAVSDTGVDVEHCYFREDASIAAGDIYGGNWDLDSRKVVYYDNTYGDSGDIEGRSFGGHGTDIAATVAGRKFFDDQENIAEGVARGAKLAVFDMKPGDGSVSDPGANRLFSSVYNNGRGAKIINASWGAKRVGYSSMCADYDRAAFTYGDVLFVSSNGNSALKDPGSCKNVLTVGGHAVGNNNEDQDYLYEWAKGGPTEDGRTKPDIVAPGCTTSAKTGTGCGTYSACGTSPAAAAASGTGAIVRQYFEQGWFPDGRAGSGEPIIPSGTLMRAVILNGGQPILGMKNTNDQQMAVVPDAFKSYDNLQNMGRLDLLSSLPLNGANDFKAVIVNDKDIASTTTDEIILAVDVQQCSAAELSVTLSWNDPPGASGCLECLLNDLNLSIIQVNNEGQQVGLILHPNGRDSPDEKNNNERIRIPDVAIGDRFRVLVEANDLSTSSQRYSLVATGCISQVEGDTVTGDDTVGRESFVETIWDGDYTNLGTMFDIKASRGVDINAFDIHTEGAGIIDVMLYVKDGSHRGFEQNPEAWTYVGTTQVEAQGSRRATPIPPESFPRIPIGGGETKSFYILVSNAGRLRYTAVDEKQVGSVFAANADLAVLVGVGNDFFVETTDRRVINGRIYYDLTSADAPIIGEIITQPLPKSECAKEDTLLQFRRERGSRKSCSWLKEEQVRISTHCSSEAGINSEADFVCPKTCGKCNECADTSTSYIGTRGTCAWLGRKTRRVAKMCSNVPGINTLSDAACPETCGKC